MIVHQHDMLIFYVKFTKVTPSPQKHIQSKHTVTILPTKLVKNAILLRKGKREKNDLYGGAVTSIFEVLWLMCPLHIKEGGGPNKHTKRILCLIFLSYFNIQILFHQETDRLFHMLLYSAQQSLFPRPRLQTSNGKASWVMVEMSTLDHSLILLPNLP